MIELIKTEITRRISVLNRRLENNSSKRTPIGMEEKDVESHKHAQEAKLTRLYAMVWELEDLLDFITKSEEGGEK